MKVKFFGILSALVLILGLVAPASAVPAPGIGATSGSADPAVYIIKLAGDPLSTYRGGLPGLQATSPEALGQSKLDAKSPASLAYLDYLTGQQAKFINSMEQALGHPAEVVYQYMVALNGLAVRMTAQEARRVSMLPAVDFVQQETFEQPDTDAGPLWIGAGSIWDGTAVPSGVGTMGEGVIVGVLDTGINHDHPSFADVGGDGYDHTNPYGAGNYVGYCVDHPEFCNDKLIGAWSYTSDEPESPEDTDGHGSHTSSTAAGNVITATRTTPSGFEIEKRISGVAPHANLIMYDVCSSGCGSAGSVAAINQAILDGVDVINFSISGGNNPYADSVELAFLGASSAGVFVSTSAGNNGPNPATVAHRSPWLASTAASTHNRLFSNSLVDMSGGDTPPPADIVGQSITTGYGPATIVYAGDFGDPLCQTPFPANTWTNGEIVVCDRGVNARVDKGANVLAGGAGGFILANDEANGNSLVADAHFLPAVHITYDDGVILKAWLATGANHTGTIAGTTTDLSPENGDILASFSSRGPNVTFDVLKPDMAAPGVAIFAAYLGDVMFEFVGGTSMASPHNAGAGALLSALYPDWTPAEMRSAIMTTASTAHLLKEDGTTPTDPFDVGAGRDDLTRAALAGLVLDETTANYQAANPSQGGDPQTLNQASLMDSVCQGICSWTRTVKSTLDDAETWTLSADVPTGMVITFEPATFELAAGASQEVVITADVTGLPLGSWVFARVNLTPTDPDVPVAHFPVAVTPFDTPPDIVVEPAALDKVQRADLVKTYPLNLANNGQLPLEWDIYEDGSDFGQALANWADNFDSYATDSSLHGQGGWKGWGNSPSATAYTRDTYAVSAPNSVEILGASDLVHEYTGMTSGVWQYTAMQYIPSTLTGETYFILLNQYDDGGATNNWSTQVKFTSITDQVINEGSVGGMLPIIYDQWVEIRVEIDLDNDIQSFYYGGDLLFSGSWTEGMSGGGILNIAAVDLFANTASAVYYDDLSLATTLPEICDQVVDMPWVNVEPISGTTPGGSTSLVGVSFDSTGYLPGDVANGTLCVASNDPDTPLVTVPLTMTVVSQGVEISPLEQAQKGVPGDVITYTYTVTNTGFETDTFTLAVAGNLWPTTVITETGPLGPGEATTVDVVVTIPTSPEDLSDTFTLTVTSVAEPGVWVQAQGTTIVQVFYTYLPLIFKNAP